MMTDSDLVNPILTHSWTPDYTFLIRKIRDDFISDGFKVMMEPVQQYMRFHISLLVSNWGDACLDKYVGSRELMMSFTLEYHTVGSYTIHYRDAHRRRVTKSYKHRWGIDNLVFRNVTDDKSIVPYTYSALFSLIPTYKKIESGKLTQHVSEIFFNGRVIPLLDVRATLTDFFGAQLRETAQFLEAKALVCDLFGSCPDELADQVSRLKNYNGQVSSMLKSFKKLSDANKINKGLNND